MSATINSVCRVFYPVIVSASGSRKLRWPQWAGDVVTNLLDSFMDDSAGFLTEHGKGAPMGRAAQSRKS